MLYMVIEQFRGGDYQAVGARFRERGRMMPEGLGLEFISSWITVDGSTCYQLMEAPDRAALQAWTRNWSDLVDFEFIEVESSTAFWASRSAR